MLKIHQHDVSNFMSCRRLFYLSFVLGYEPAVIRKYLNIGDLFARCTYWLHKGEDIGYCMALVDAEQEKIQAQAKSQEQINALETNVQIVQSMLFGYEHHFMSHRDPRALPLIREIKPEYAIEIPISDQIIYVCRLDGRIVDIYMKDWILELKTSQEQATLVKILPLNFQINSYWWALNRKTESPVSGVVYRFVRKPSIKQKKDASLDEYRQRLMKDYVDRPDFYFGEQQLSFDQTVLNTFEKNLMQIFNDIVECFHTNTWTYNGNHCNNNWGLCPYLDFCKNPTPETLETFYIKTDETQELDINYDYLIKKAGGRVKELVRGKIKKRVEDRLKGMKKGEGR